MQKLLGKLIEAIAIMQNFLPNYQAGFATRRLEEAMLYRDKE